LPKKIGSLLNVSWEDIDVSAQADCFMSAICNNYGLNPILTKDIIQGTVDFSTFYFQEGFSYPERLQAAKTGLGSFVNEFYQRMEDTINHKDNKKFVLYSAHDTTVMPFLIALDMWDDKWPPYAAIITSELHDNGTVTVRFTYNGNVIYLPGCGEYCPLEHFKNLVKLVTPKQGDCDVPLKKKPKVDIFTVL